MTDPLTPVPDADAVDVLEDFTLPASWGSAAVDAFREVLTVRPELEGTELVALEQACGLIDTAERLEAIARAADFTAIGSQGQTVAHWGLSEVRLARNQAAAILHRLTRAVGSPVMSNSERGRMAASARWANHAGRGGRQHG